MRRENMFGGKALFVAVLLFMSLVITVRAQTNPIPGENALTGTLDWQIPKVKGLDPFYQPANNHELEGYANKTSVNAGEQIRFHLSSRVMTQTVNIQIYRLGYYQGLGGRLKHTTRAVNVTAMPYAAHDPITGRAECNWLSPATAFWDVPTNAVSGVYLAKITGNSSGHQSYIPFVVRRDDLNSDLLFQRAVTTSQAYNNYPGQVDSDPDSNLNGKSMYPFNSSGPALPGDTRRQAREVSFNRPYQISSNFGIYDSAGGTVFNYEYPLIRWLEKEGYFVTYATDIDTHANPGLLAAGKHKALLSNGHDEYWSWEMRDKVEQARNRTNQPLNLGFFGGNQCYWQIRLKPSSASGTQPVNANDRTMVCYKETARSLNILAADPYYTDGNSANDFEIADLWRKNTIKPPEDELIGVMTIPPPMQAGDPDIYCCSNNTVVFAQTAPSWILAGTIGQRLPNLVGYEADDFYQSYPNRTTYIVASSPFVADRNGNEVLLGTSEMTYYKMNTGAKVFSSGSIQWAWGLDDWGADPAVGPVINGRPASRRDDAETITRNIVNCLINQNVACN